MENVLIAGRVDQVSNYVAAVRKVGAVPLVSLRIEDAWMCDGLLLPGGGDISPTFWGAQGTGTDEELDRIQFSMLHIAVCRRIPVLGICKGHQLAHVYFGGTIWEDLECAERHTGVDGHDRYHPVELAPGGVLSGLYQKDFSSQMKGNAAAAQKVFMVNSYHHQGIRRPGSNLRTEAIWREGMQSVIEASSHSFLPILTTQWHPERLMGQYGCPDCVDGEVIFRSFLQKIRDCQSACAQ